MPFDSLIYVFPDLFFLPAMEVLPSYSGCCRRETGFSSSIPHSCGSWELTHCSLFFLRGEVITDYFIPMLCHLQEGAPLAKFLLPSSMCPVLFFFSLSLMESWTLSLGRLDFYKVSLIYGCLSKSALFCFSPAGAERGCGQLANSC